MKACENGDMKTGTCTYFQRVGGAPRVPANRDAGLLCMQIIEGMAGFAETRRSKKVCVPVCPAPS